MKKNETISTTSKAKWEAPELVTIDASLANVEAALAPGTDSLMFGGSSSQS